MKLLKELLFGCSVHSVIGDTNVPIASIHFNSNDISESSLFVAIKGVKKNGHNFITDSILLGAVAVVCEKLPDEINHNVTYVQVGNSAHVLGLLSSNFFDNPSSKLKLVGITGTNGKTSIAHYLSDLFTNLNFKIGLISTTKNRIHKQSYPSTHTTPNAFEINRLLSLMVQNGCQFCFMEVSSHGIMQDRIAGLNFSIAVFSNISRDHLDYHKSFNNYITAKKLLFDSLSPNSISIVNADDKYSATMLMDTKSKKILYGIQSNTHYKASVLESSFSGLSLNIENKSVNTMLIGDFNAYNLLAVYAVAHQLGQDKNSIIHALSMIQPVAGRFNIIKSESGVIGLVDYAHTPDALQKVVLSIANFCNPVKDLIIVLGCGGNRDQGKRSIMGQIAFKNSIKTIFTSDNPRNEDPMSIINDMCLALPDRDHEKVHKMINRKEAIKFACGYASKGQVVLVAGKGHEQFQEINGEKQPFDDFQILSKIINT
tara:strand:+ start:878 stop:2332 length:1455 start_codon:yes stop_codon:yes gene_type:complete